MAKTEPKYAVIEVRIPVFEGDFDHLPVEVTTHVGNTVTKHDGELTLCDGLDTAMFDGTPLHNRVERAEGTAPDDLDNFSHFTTGDHFPYLQNSLLWALHDWDIDAIADEVLGGHEEGYACRVSAEEFWDIARKHDRTLQ